MTQFLLFMKLFLFVNLDCIFKRTVIHYQLMDSAFTFVACLHSYTVNKFNVRVEKTHTAVYSTNNYTNNNTQITNTSKKTCGVYTNVKKLL